MPAFSYKGNKYEIERAPPLPVMAVYELKDLGGHVIHTFPAAEDPGYLEMTAESVVWLESNEPAPTN